MSSSLAATGAAGGDPPPPPPVPSSLHRDELSLYAAPERPCAGHFPAREPVPLEQHVSDLRRSAQPYTGWCRDAYGYIRPQIQRVSDAYVYLIKDPPKDLYPRAGVIGVTGVLGLLLGRGSRVKTLLYPAGLMGVSAALYYPERAAGVARAAGEDVYERAVLGYAALERALKAPKAPEKSGGNTKP